MPCNSDYLEAKPIEIEVDRMYRILDEINEGVANYDNLGYHNQVYGRGNLPELRDELAQAICTSLRDETPADIQQYSLELQIWWRDHQKADQVRIEAEKKLREQTRLAESAISKLSKDEYEAVKEFFAKGEI